MGTYVNSNVVTLGAEYDYDNAVREIGALLGVGAREDGMCRLADICRSASVNVWSKRKPFPSTKTSFASDAEKEAEMYSVFWGITSSVTLHPDNPIIYIQEWFRRTIPSDYFVRLRDFDGYNHVAKDGINIKSAPSVDANIVLEVNPDTGDNVTMRDVVDSYSFDSYEWMLIDPFGFYHSLSAKYGKQGLLDYLYGSGQKLSVKIADYANSAFNVYTAIPSTGYTNKQWILGLVGWKSQLSEGYVLNPVRFNDLRVSETLVKCNGFSPKMVLGTASMGKSVLYQHIYGDKGSIDCCSDDFLFLGCVIQNGMTTSLAGSNLRVLMITNISAVKPYSTQLIQYNKALDTPIASANSAGTGGGLGTNWANGMNYIRTSSIWTIGGGTTNFAGFMAIAHYESASKIHLLTPYIRIGLKNNGTKVDDLTIPSATLPEVRPQTGWIQL